jgi:rhamnosyltransferase
MSKTTPSAETLHASIVIPTKNGEKWIDDCLKSVFSQRSKAPFEVVIVDSGSSDRTLEIARKYPVRLETIPAQDFHHARTRNYAASLTTGKYLVLLSQDAIPASSQWLAAMLQNFDDPKVGAVYGQQIPTKGSSPERHSTLNTMYGDERLVKEPASKAALGYKYYHFSDANAAISRKVWEMTRFPDDLKVFEDLGIAKRILDSGWKIVYEPRACVIHSHNHSTLQLFQRYFDIGFTFRRLGIWNDRAQSSMLAEILKLAKRRLQRKAQPGSVRDLHGIISGIKNDFAKSAGFWLGVHERYLPGAAKRFFSAHQVCD